MSEVGPEVVSDIKNGNVRTKLYLARNLPTQHTLSPHSLSSEMLIPTYNITQCNYPEENAPTTTVTSNTSYLTNL
jgi:uncharacterized protein (DUF427 family)